MDSDQATAPPFFKYIHGDDTWWESLEWDDPLAKTILEPYLLDYLDYEDYEKDYLNFEDYVDYADSVDYEDLDDEDYEDPDLNKLLDKSDDFLSAMSSNLIHLNK
ncbi:hypothetical protein RHGRI_032479 [Rhododendron griersonianum]|uniref:Uncharacterized protein n=1 Tax=Rhododendron griersonianum TaxID=479676 RepID=A0AAV6IHS9_9ERIC|nr:hypothetical protein RHGRI_032479 [Rhododendron griersonianum]